MGDVMRASGNQQRPAIYNQFPGLAFLSPPPVPEKAAVPAASPLPVTAPVAAAPEQTPPAAANITAPANEPVATREAPPVLAKPVPLPPPKQPKSAAELKAAHLNTIGASVGSSFSAPWLIGTIHGTYSPLGNLFLELGFDLGLVSGAADVKYYSLYPYAHAAFFWPFANKGGIYAGAGGGYRITKYTFQIEGKLAKNGMAADIIAGVNLFDMVNLSYTFRTNFDGVDNKISVGYVYRFK